MYRGEREYDVFVCFRGDTRRFFTSHLKDALSGKQIKTFIDTMLAKTESIDELLSVLQRSALSVVVFSEKFAESPWCLDEVATIARSMKDFGHRALPVFYNVDPSDVWEKSGSYSATIDELLEASPGAGEKTGWMDALKEVAKCAGFTSDDIKIESELVKAVVKEVLKTLVDMSPSVISNKLVDMGLRVLEVEQLLAMDEVADTRIIGLWGMGGSGKTTLAEACYQRQTSSPSSPKGPLIKHYIIRNINEKQKGQCGIDGLIQKLYSHLLSEDKLTREDLNDRSRRNRLSNLRVFLVLDDVESLWQLDQLLLGSIFSRDTQLFAPGSRIIVTARDRKAMERRQVVKIHPVDCLQEDGSLQLFSLFAFERSLPPDNDWMALSRTALSYCNGNPLALKILGGALHDRNTSYWESFLHGLTRRRGVSGVREILRKSYDGLQVEQQKRLFLDFACFLHGMSRCRLISYMIDSFYDAYSDVEDLINMSLLVCVAGKDGEIIEVHDLLKDMAWQIVNEEPELTKRIWLEHPQDIAKVLQTHMGDLATEGISPNLFMATDINLKANAFEGMKHLRWLRFCSFDMKLHIPGGIIDFLPAKLRGLQWDKYPLKSLPSGFSPENLKILALRYGSIVKCWEGESQAAKLVNLVELDLSWCSRLTAIPDLSKSLHLEVLILARCYKLVELPSDVGSLMKLVRLDVRGCIGLKDIPTNLKSKDLKYVLMSNCFKVNHCPEIDSTVLKVLDLNGTPINAAPPNSIYNKIKQGGSLRLHCPQITNFPHVPTRLKLLHLFSTSISEIEFQNQQHSSTTTEIDSSATDDGPRFKQLKLVDNSKLKNLAADIWKMVSKELVIVNSPLIETLPEIPEPTDVKGLTWLSVTRCKLLKHVPSTINNLKSLQILDFSWTGIETLPSCIEELGELLELQLGYCASLQNIPDVLYKLAKLSELNVTGSKKLTSLPRLPSSLELLSAEDCKSLQVLPSDIGELSCKDTCFCCRPQSNKVSLDRLVSVFQQQDMPRHSERIRLHPWNELPDWFHYQSEEGDVGVWVMERFGSFSKYLWRFVNDQAQPIRSPRQVPEKSAEAVAISKDLMRRGFRRVGPTIVYSFMQSTEITNDYLISCFRFQECVNMAEGKEENGTIKAAAAVA